MGLHGTRLVTTAELRGKCVLLHYTALFHVSPRREKVGRLTVRFTDLKKMAGISGLTVMIMQDL